MLKVTVFRVPSGLNPDGCGLFKNADFCLYDTDSMVLSFSALSVKEE